VGRLFLASCHVGKRNLAHKFHNLTGFGHMALPDMFHHDKALEPPTSNRWDRSAQEHRDYQPMLRPRARTSNLQRSLCSRQRPQHQLHPCNFPLRKAEFLPWLMGSNGHEGNCG
jgi:hypothetical protein